MAKRKCVHHTNGRKWLQGWTWPCRQRLAQHRCEANTRTHKRQHSQQKLVTTDRVRTAIKLARYTVRMSAENANRQYRIMMTLMHQALVFLFTRGWTIRRNEFRRRSSVQWNKEKPHLHRFVQNDASANAHKKTAKISPGFLAVSKRWPFWINTTWVFCPNKVMQAMTQGPIDVIHGDENSTRTEKDSNGVSS